MRFNFDIEEETTSNNNNGDKLKLGNNNNNKIVKVKKERQLRSPHSSSIPKDEVQWVPLQDHPVFSSAVDGEDSSTGRFPTNLMAWDGASRIYFWDSELACLHRISVRLGDPEPNSVTAAYPSKVLEADIDLDFVVNKISINKNGSALLLGSSAGIHILYLYGRNSVKDDSIICRTVPVGNTIYQQSNSTIRILQVAWHPYSNTHLAVLSSDSVFRIFDWSSGFDLPEQEYYLQPVESGRSRSASSICPVDFSFGRDHLWDRFSVFILFSDGSVYTLCPVAPFGSIYLWESIQEIYSDAQTFGQKSDDPIAFSNSSMAISWLEATFPELNQQESEASNMLAVEAQRFVVIDSSLSLQGPLGKVCRGTEDDPGFRGAKCSGRAVSFLYNSVRKDSILVTAWSSGQLQIDALADEVQPLWNSGNPPHLSFDSRDRILGFAMICESVGGQLPVVRLDQPLDYCDWSGHPPPLLRLAIVDLALPTGKVGDSTISMYIDPLIPERVYCLHDGGVDSIVLHFLPFTDQASIKGEMMKTPSVHPVISTSCIGSAASSAPLCGFVVLSDSFGFSWVVGVTSTRECIVLEMKTLYTLLTRVMDTDNKPRESGGGDKITPDIISRELLVGPKAVMVPHGSNLRSVSADSIEGRSTLHHYFKLFHENYVEYAHKVHFALEHHGPHVKKIIDNLHTRLSEAQQKLLNAEKKQPQVADRMRRVIERHESLEQRLLQLRRLPGIHKKPLTKAEREFRADLDNFAGVELDALHTSIEALNGRLRKYTMSNKSKLLNRASRKKTFRDTKLDHLKASLEQLWIVNSENSKKLKLVESALEDLAI
ncbi:nuclear pore complex protein NUP88 [Silene latifolia]|uniref:nuclear pore complex protein NUP88 n=1 Tax=Silene latifolia TaxID=37657 RepID=UPI003D780757